MNRTSPYYCRRSVLSLLISALIYAPPGMAAFTTNVIGVVNDETVDGNQKVDERGTTNNTHIINHGQQNVHGGVSNGSLIESGGYQDIGSHNNFVGQANNTTINGGRQSIHDGGISTGTTIESGNQDVYKGGISNGTTIKGGASRVEGGSANGILIDGGSQIVKVQGHADGTTINKSGSQDVVQGSLATNTTINGGRQYVEQSTVETTTIKNGGEQRVYESRALDTTIPDNVRAAVRHFPRNTVFQNADHGHIGKTGRTVNLTGLGKIKHASCLPGLSAGRENRGTGLWLSAHSAQNQYLHSGS